MPKADAPDASDNYTFTFNTSALFDTDQKLDTRMPVLEEKSSAGGFPAGATLRPDLSVRFHTPAQGGPFIDGFCDPENDRFFLAGRSETQSLQSFNYDWVSGTFTLFGTPAAIPNGANEVVVEMGGSKAYVGAAPSWANMDTTDTDQYLHVLDINTGQVLWTQDMGVPLGTFALLRNNQRLLVGVEGQGVKYLDVVDDQNIGVLSDPGAIGEWALMDLVTIEEGTETVQMGCRYPTEIP